MKFDIIIPSEIGRKINDEYITSSTDENETILFIRSSIDFNEKKYLLRRGKCSLAFILNDEYLVFYNYRNDGFSIFSLGSKTFTSSNENIIPEYNFNNFFQLLLDRNNQKYIISDIKKNISFEFIPDNNYGYIWIPSGVLEYYNRSKTNNWLRLLDPATGQEKWRVNYPYEIGGIKECNDVIVFYYQEYSGIRTDAGYEGEVDWGNPKRYNIGIDANTGEEIWKYYRPRHGLDFNIDKERGTFLCMQSSSFNAAYGRIESANVWEIDIKTGQLLLDIAVQPLDAMGFMPHFADDEAVYYTNHYGSFGKIRRNDGMVEWEFDLIDLKNTKRKVLNWLKLGNGKFVLQTPPNHKNGDLTCIFDPTENLAEASVINGKRIKDVLKK